jgi:hypothetical protein
MGDHNVNETQTVDAGEDQFGFEVTGLGGNLIMIGIFLLLAMVILLVFTTYIYNKVCCLDYLKLLNYF